MSLAQRFERRLEGAVGSAFARVFKGQVEPVEIGTALQREAADKRAVMGSGQVLAPNRYRVSLGPSDHERLVPWQAQLCNSLAELVQESLDGNGWATIGDVEVLLHLEPTLHTGVFGVASRMEAAAPPRQRPLESLSLPSVPGQAPGTYARPFGSPAGPPSYQPPPSYPPVPAYAQPGADYGQQQAPMQQAPMQPQAPAQQQAPPYLEPPHRPRLRAVLTVDGSPEHLVLRRGSNVVGRGQDCALQVMDQGVSRRHVDIQFDGEFAVAYDLGSTNGTTVNGHTVGSQQLQHGDVLRVGHSRVVYQEESA